ncbi:MAG: HlyC/CorC family transporter [candidate division Zixibacteria bacterium]|nr:HlyC/CorC family transporter [candidate division Zixibacteria bacterium]
MLYELLIILGLTIINGIFAAAEIAIVALRASRIEQRIKEGSRGAWAVKRLRAAPERFLATVQIGITVVGAFAGAFGGATFAEDLAPLLRNIEPIAGHEEAIALAVVVVIISYFSLVLGELVPKSLALRFSEGYAFWIGRPLLGLSWLARPLVWFLTASSNLLLKCFGDSTTFTETRLSSEELQRLVDEAAEAGSVDPGAGEIASRALEFGDLAAGQVMVPRSRVVALPMSASLDDLRALVGETGHTRIPVYDRDIDHVIGYVNVKDIVAHERYRDVRTVGDIVRPAYLISPTMRTVALLGEMKKRRMQLAIVVDDHGGMSGIVTLEDLVEELVGEIFSEHDAPPKETIRREPDGSIVVEGRVTVREVNREVGLALPIAKDYSTIAGLCLDLAGRIPSRGEVIETPDGTRIEVIDASPRHVVTVRLFLQARDIQDDHL